MDARQADASVNKDNLNVYYGPGGAPDGSGKGQAQQTSIPIPANQVNSSEKIGKYNGGILRYPYESLTDKTDYLQIDIRNYNSASSVSKGGLA